MTSRKAADQWARIRGYADFDSYIATGGSLLEARQDIRNRMLKMGELLAWLGTYHTTPIPPTEDQPTDPANAHIQGAEEA